MSFTNLFLQAETTPANTDASVAAGDPNGTQADAGILGGPLGSILPFVAIIAIFYFFIIRPQNKKQKETERMIKAIKKGDKVVTIGGIHGVVSSAKETTLIIKVDDNTKIEFNRSAIATVVAGNASEETKSEVNK
ncbi:MAG: preprotein translocase subunit YajC [Treponema sp.]|nr:preprotein translocase subunit YajC [Treponema sp.]